MRGIIAVLICLAPVGCSSLRLVKADPPPVSAMGSPPPGVAQVCVLRPHWIAPSITLAVHDNGQLVGATRGDTYFCYFAGIGWHVLTTEVDEPGAIQEPQSVVFAAAAGQRLYLHHHMRPFGIWSAAWVDEGTASRMVGDCGYRVIAAGAGAPAPSPVPSIPGTPAPPAPRGS